MTLGFLHALHLCGKLKGSVDNPAGSNVSCGVLEVVSDPWLLTSQAAHGPTDVAGEAAAKLTSAEECWRSPGHSLHAGN